MAARIEDYALVGDGRTAALISRDGSVDWLCWPRFDASACFAALLGTEDHGFWRIAPTAKHVETTRRYRDGSLVLETRHKTRDGEVLVTDYMPAGDGSHLIRLVEGVHGRVAMRMDLSLRFDYGSAVPWVSHNELGDLRAISGPHKVVLRTKAHLHGVDQTTVSEFTAHAGETMAFTLSYGASHEDDPPPIEPRKVLAATDAFWRDWSRRCTGGTPWDDVLKRSLLTLKALIYMPTGGIVAAPTTSLPEQLGGVRNWDYRFCWLRDSTFTLLALMDAGFIEEARAWRDWLLRAVAGNPEQAHILYGIAGERLLPEIELDWLPGYEGSRPVRVGNAAVAQFQLDVYGELFDALYQARRRGMESDRDGWRVGLALMEHLEKVWSEPDEGIWEVRGGQALRALEGDGLGGLRPGHPLAGGGPAARLGHPDRALARHPRPDPRRGLPEGVRSGTQQLRAVLRLEAPRREPAADRPYGVPAAGRSPRRRHRRGGRHAPPARRLRAALRHGRPGDRRAAGGRGRVPALQLLVRGQPDRARAL